MQMKPERLAMLREYMDERTVPSYALVRELLADRDWHRKRVQVTTNDIRRAGVKWAHMQAWLEKTGPIAAHEDLGERPDLLMLLIEQELDDLLPKVRAAFAAGTTEVDVDTDVGRDRVVARCSVGVRIDWIDAELKTEGRRS